MGPVLHFIRNASGMRRPLLAVLIDPGKLSLNRLRQLLMLANVAPPDLFFLGGSTASPEDLRKVIDEVRRAHPKIPRVIFPGHETQICSDADALLLLSLVSGRNSDLLIGKHVRAAKALQQSQLEIIPTGYMLVESGKMTTVAYLSQTQPIPRDTADLAASTALAAQFLGMQLIYLEAGSGARWPVPPEMIHAVKMELDIPLIVGGGIDSPEKLQLACNAGADVIVVGNALERDPELLLHLHQQLTDRAIG